MAIAKRKVDRPYAPDFVSAETLAYRLDISLTKLREHVREHRLPQPVHLGGSVLWHWRAVEACLIRQSGDASDPFDRAVAAVGNSKN